MISFSFLMKKDVESLKKKAEFNEDQIIILNHLVSGDKTDEGIMMELGISRNKYYKIKTELIEKIIRTAVQS